MVRLHVGGLRDWRIGDVQVLNSFGSHGGVIGKQSGSLERFRVTPATSSPAFHVQVQIGVMEIEIQYKFIAIEKVGQHSARVRKRELVERGRL
jgi:hypothetical protein